MATELSNATDKAERKRQAISYLKENGVPKRIENLLNTVVNDNPNDLFGFMAKYFDQLAKSPSITNVVASEIFSPRGYPSFQVKIECLIHGAVQSFPGFAAPMDGKPNIEMKQTKGRSSAPGSEIKLKLSGSEQWKDTDMENEADKVQTLINSINCDIKSNLVGCKLFEQQEVDRVLEDMAAKITTENETAESEYEETTKNDESQPNDEEELPDVCSLPETRFDALTVSLAVADTAAHLQKRHLYECLYTTINSKEPSSLCLPTPMMPMLGSGKRTSGKLYVIKDVMVFAKQNMVSLQALKQLTNIYQQLETIVHQKTPTGSNTTVENGALAPPIDRPEQAIEMVREAVIAAGYAHDSDVSIALRCSPADVYDKDKQKYEISAGTFKSADELINMYGDLCERYPEIKVIMDPLVAEDRPGWSKLNEKVGEKCFLINDQSYPNQRNLLKNILHENLVSGNVVKVHDSSTVTEFLEHAKPFEGQPRILFISHDEVVGHENYMVDMAVATEADFVILGTPGRSENAAKYNRLIDIERDLVTSGKFQQRQPLDPPFVVSTDEKQCEET